MSSFASIRPRISEWRGWLPLVALPPFMFIALLALGGDRAYFYRDGGTHDHAMARTLAVAENLSPKHDFRLASRVRLNEEGGFAYSLYGRFPIGSYVLVKPAILPFGDDLAAKTLAARVLAMLMFCGAAALASLAIARIAGSRWVGFAAAALAFSGFYAVYYADGLFGEGVMDLFGAALVFHGMVVFAQEGSFRQLLVKTCAALLIGWHVYALLLPFIALGFGGEAIALLRSALASDERARAARAAISSLARSRYVALAAVAILFGAALLGFNLANEYAAYGGERALSDLPTVSSALRRFGQTGDYEQFAERLAWDNFLRLQFYRAGVEFVPYAIVRAGGYGVSLPDPLDPPLAPAVLGAAATVAALAALAFARRSRVLTASAILFGFCWAIPMRYNTFVVGHSYESLPYIFLALSIFALALMGARRLLGERVGERIALGIGAAAALVFAASVFYAGQFDRAGGEAEREKTEMSEFSAIRGMTRGSEVETLPQYMFGGSQTDYYLAGVYRGGNRADACDPGVADFVVSSYRHESLSLLTPDNRFVFLYESASPLELCRAERRRLEASEPTARGKFDVYLEDGALSYLKAPCEPSDYEAAFFAFAYPVDANDLREVERRNGYVKLRVDQMAAFDSACLLSLYLPAYPIAAIRAGQWIHSGESQWDMSILWEVSANPPLGAEARAFYEDAWQAIIESGAPAARSGFDLYLDGDALSYLKEPCGESDARGRFFLSVHPANVEDLPEDRRELGHESLNFTFAPPHGVIFDGKCMATRMLPDYEIARIETGQWVPGGDELWKAGIAVGD